MIDETNDVVTPQPTEQQSPVEKVEKVETETRDVVREYNLRALRERAEAAERKAQELEQQISQSHQPPQYAQQPPPIPVPDEMSFGDEELVEGKQIKKLIQSERNRVDREIQQIKSQSAIDNAERRLRSTYADVDEVLSEDNIKNFKVLYPEEFSSAMSNQDPYARMKTAYTLINHLKISDKPQTRDVDRRLEQNKLMPRAAATAASASAETPLSRVSDFDRRVLTDEMKQQNLRNLAMAKEALKYRRE